MPACRANKCHVRYRFLLPDASKSLHDPDVALAHDDVFVAPPSTWLLRPLSDRVDRSFRFHVTTPDDVTFASGVFPAQSEPSTFRAGVTDLPASPYSAFGRLRTMRFDVGGRAID